MGRKPNPDNLCKDCGVYIFRAKYGLFMAQDILWDKFGVGDDNLCLSCFQIRIGRPLVKDDFTDCNLNKSNSFIQNLK